MGDSAERKTVVVTGFGPFGCHSVNASWVAVQELEKMGLSHDVDLVTYELPVKYAMVRECIPSLWKKCQPTLVVHVGVSGIAKEITLEQQAHNEGYDKVDVEGSLPACNECVAGGAGTIVSDIVMGHVSNAVNCSECKATAVVSRDPGRYLCDFTYYSSLSIDEHRSAFIHVPPLDKPYSAQELADGLKVAINAMLKQIT